LVSLGICFLLSLVLVFSSVFSSSSFTPPNNAFAADMDMGGDSGGDSNQGGDNNQGGDSRDDMPKDAPQTTGALTAGGDSDNDDDDDNDSGGNQDDDNDNEPTPKDAPVTTDTATTKNKECPEGQEYTLFSGCVEAAENPGNTGVSNSPPTTCPASYSPNEKDPMIRAKSEDVTMSKYPLTYVSIQSPMVTGGLIHGIEPRVQLVANPFLDFDECSRTDSTDPTTGIASTTIKYADGSTTIEKKASVEEAGLISSDKYDKKGMLKSSTAWQTANNDPNSGKAVVNVQKDGKKDITIANGDGGSTTKFTMTKSGKIILNLVRINLKLLKSLTLQMVLQ
jgi:hypothetical protein